MSCPLVSVIMPVYNGARFIGTAIESVLAQSYGNLELIIIDDGSTDGTREVICRHHDERIRLMVQDRNYGLVYTRNSGISKAHGDYIAMLDADDIALPERFKEQVSFFESHPDFVMIGSRLRVIDEFGEQTGETWDYPYRAESVPSRMLFHNCFAQSAVCVRRSALSDCGYRMEFPSAEDYDLWVRLARKGKVGNLSQYLLLHRRHSSSTSAVYPTVMEEAVLRIISEQLLGLGVEATSYELSLHRSVGECIAVDWTRQRLLDLDAWLHRLYWVNLERRVYSEDAFKEVIAERWFCACREAVASGVNICGIYFCSPLRASGCFVLLRDTKLFTRSLINSVLVKMGAKKESVR